MKKYLGILLLGGCIITLASFQQQKPKDKKPTYRGKTFLAGGVYGNGKVPAKVFDSLMKLPLVSVDSANISHPVTEFSFTYAERGAYEDSTGTLKIMTDYFSVSSEKGLLPDYYINSLKDRVKYGDTVYYNEVIGRFADSLGTKYMSAPIKIILTDK